VDNVNIMEKTYHHGNLRAALIEAGLAALEQQDTADLSLRAIARDVGVSANAAYRHFADKDALLAAVAAEGFRRFAQHQSQAAQGHATALEARVAAGRAYVQFAQDHPALFRLMFGRLLNATAPAELQDSAGMAFQGLLEASARESTTPADSDHVLTLAIARWSMVHGLSHLILDGQLAHFGDDVNRIVDNVLSLSKDSLMPISK
jgi:AcrR family transcriptional regulator